MPGPVEITFYNSVTDNDKQLMLTHWSSGIIVLSFCSGII